MKTVKPFQSGNSQAIRIPKEFRFKENEELTIRKEGNALILQSLDKWPKQLLDLLGTGKEPLPRPKQSALSEVKNPFSQVV